MHQHHLHITATDRPELPERVLRVVRPRGFRIDALNLCAENGCIALDLKVSSSRPLHLLTRQLEKLPDVRELRYPGLSLEALRA